MSTPIMGCGHRADGENVRKEPVCTKCAGKHPNFDKLKTQRRGLLDRMRHTIDDSGIIDPVYCRTAELEPEEEPDPSFFDPR